MSELEQVLHKPTPPNDERWHIVLQGHPDELLVALAALMEYLQNVIITAEWTGLDALTIW